MLIYLIAGAAVMTATLLGLWIMGRVKARPVAMKPAHGVSFATAVTDIDLQVIGAEAWWQHLKPMPLFWVGCFFTAVIIGLDYQFGLSRYPKTIGMALVIGSLFAAADIAIPFIAIKSELTPRRDPVATGLIWLFTLMSLVVVVGSTAEVSTTAGARTDVAVTSHEDDMRLLKQMQAERDSIPMNRGFEALDKLAKATEEAGDREKDRTRCGPKCEKLKADAADLRAQADQAKRKEELTGKIEALKAKIAGGDTSETRLDTDPLATAIEGMTGGNISRDGVRRYGLTVLGILLVVGVTLVWLQVGVALREEIEWELAHRGEIADAMRANLGLPPRYTVPATPAALITDQNAKPSADPTMVFNIAAEDRRKRYANDEDLLETDSLFEKLLVRAEGGSVHVGELYKMFQIMRRVRDQNAVYMTQPTMFRCLRTVSLDRDDVEITADGIIKNWLLKPTDQIIRENANVV